MMDPISRKDSVRLTAELWCRIIGNVTHRAPQLIQLASVCKLWRYGIQKEPALWAHVICEQDGDLNRQQLELQLRLSAGLTLTVIIATNGDNWPIHQHLIQRVLSEHHRISSLRLYIGLFRDWGFSSILPEVVGKLIDGSNWPVLTSIDLSIFQTVRQINIPVNITAPNIINISVEHWRVYAWQHLASGALRSMSIRHDDDEPFTLPMAACPNIETLHVRKRKAVFSRTVAAQSLWVGLTSVSFACVTIETEDLDAFLECCPSLTRLAIQIDVPPETVEHLLQCVPATLRHLSLSVNQHFRLNPLFPDDRLRMLESLRVVGAFILQPSSVLGSNIQVFDVSSIYMHLTDLATALVSGTLNKLRTLRLRDIKRSSLLDDEEPWAHVLGVIAGVAPFLSSLEDMEIEFTPGAAEDYSTSFPRVPHVDLVNFIAVLIAVFVNPRCPVRSVILRPLALRPGQVETLFSGVDLEVGKSKVTVFDETVSHVTLKHIFFTGKKAGAPFRVEVLVDLAELEAAQAQGGDLAKETGTLGKLISLLQATP